MNLGGISLGALAVAVLLSCTTRLNVGLVAVAFAWIIGVYLGKMPVKEVAAGFPADLFLTLAGVTLLFAQARVNGTLDRVAQHAVRLCRGNAGAVAVMAPMAMQTARRMGIPLFLMAILVGNGSNAGSLSPLAPTGIIVSGLMARIGLGGHEAATYLYNLLAHAGVAFTGFVLFGGWRLFGRQGGEAAAASDAVALERRHWVTIGVIAALVAGALGFKIHIGMAAFAAAVLLTLLDAADEGEAIKAMPWATILMVCGVTVLIAILEKTQGLALFAGWIANYSSKETISAMIAFFTGLISVYSSTSGVVLPAFLPMIPGLVEKLGGGDPLLIASAMNVGGHLVDVSPLSTIGALCVAGAGGPAESKRLFNQLLAWGMSMTVVGAAIGYLFF
jgi:di/tricarboxylate transporter